MKFALIGLGLVAVIVFVIVLAKSDDPPTEPEPVAEAFVRAVADPDGTDACELLVRKLAAQMAEEVLACSGYFEGGQTKALEAVGSSSVEAVRVQDNTATATLSDTGQPLKLTREGDAWRVECIPGVPGVGYVVC